MTTQNLVPEIKKEEKGVEKIVDELLEEKHKNEECQSFCKCCELLEKHPLYPKVNYLVHWRDIPRSGLIFATLNLFFYLITFGGYTLLSLTSYAFFFILLISIGYSLFLSFKQSKNTLEERFNGSEFSISKEGLEEHVKIVHAVIEDIKGYLTQLILCKHLGSTVKAVFASYFLSIITGCCSIVTFIWIGTIIAFTIPPVYELKKEEIDKFLGIACEHINKYQNLAAEKMSTIPVLNTLVGKPKTD